MEITKKQNIDGVMTSVDLRFITRTYEYEFAYSHVTRYIHILLYLGLLIVMTKGAKFKTIPALYKQNKNYLSITISQKISTDCDKCLYLL